MNCPECGGKTDVIDSREMLYGRRRRHKCRYCYHRFTTVEMPIEEYEIMKLKAKNLNKAKQLSKQINGLFKETEKGGGSDA